MIRMRCHSVALALAASMVACAGCEAQNQMEELEYRVDDTPIEREDTPVVTSYAGMLKDVRPAVVSVYSRRVVEEQGLMDHPLFRQFFGENGDEMGQDMGEREARGIGSGVVISPQGFILTNNHVIADAEEIAVRMEDGQEFNAEVVGRDPPSDVAVLRVDGEDLPTAVLGDSDQAEVGDVVFALGNALGIGHAVTTGIVSARGRTEIGILGEEGFEDFIQTDAPMNIGNSGGPLIDSSGRVIGINTAIASPGGGNIGIGFAIPINLARSVMEDLIEHGEVQRGFLGIRMQALTAELAEEFEVPDTRGALVVSVMPDSPAAEAELESGDVIVEVEGDPVASPGDLRVRIGQLPPGESVSLGVVRDGDSRTMEVELGRQDRVEDEPVAAEQPDPLEGEEFLPGVVVEPLSPELRQEIGLPEEMDGIVVTAVDPRSPFGQVLPPGAVIVQINREVVEDVEKAREALRDGRNLFLTHFGGSLNYVVVELDE